MSILEFLNFKKKKRVNSPRIDEDRESIKKFPDRVRVKRKPPGEFFKKAKSRLTGQELSYLQENVFRIKGEFIVTPEHKRRVEEWLEIFRTQNATSKEVWNLINSDKKKVWLKNFSNSLLEFAMTNDQGVEPPLEFLYGKLRTLYDAYPDRTTFLSEYKSIKKIFEEAQRIDEENQRERLAAKFAADLITLLKSKGGLFKVLSEEFFFESLKKIIKDEGKSHWHKKILFLLEQEYEASFIQILIKDFLKKYYAKNNAKRIAYESNNSFSIIDEEFLSKINPEKEVQVVSPEFEIPEGKVKIVELFTREQLKDESRILNTCVGDDDTYSNKIRRGEIRIFSVRLADSLDIKTAVDSVYTIEYDISRGEILQLKGYDNFETRDEETIKSIIRVLRELGISVNYVELSDWMVLEKNGEHKFFYGNSLATSPRVVDLLMDGYSNYSSSPVDLDLISDFDLLEEDSIESELGEEFQTTVMDILGLEYVFVDLSHVLRMEFLKKITEIKSAVQDSIVEKGGFAFENLRKIDGYLKYKMLKWNQNFANYGPTRYPVLEEVGGAIYIDCTNGSLPKIKRKDVVEMCIYLFPNLKYKNMSMKNEPKKIIKEMLKDGKLIFWLN